MHKCVAGIAALLILCTACGAPAGPRKVAIIADTVASATPHKPGYPVLIGKNLGWTAQDLSTVKKPPVFTAAEALQQQLPVVPADTTDALIAIGPTDLDWMARGFEQLAAVEDADLAIVNALLERHIHVYQVTVRDYTSDRHWRRGSIPLRRAQRIPEWTRLLNRFIAATPGITVIDLTTHPELEKPGFYEGDGIHLSPAGQEAYAAVISDLIAGNTAWRQKAAKP